VNCLCTLQEQEGAWLHAGRQPEPEMLVKNHELMKGNARFVTS
jgi:hypothetical protein